MFFNTDAANAFYLRPNSNPVYDINEDLYNASAQRRREDAPATLRDMGMDRYQRNGDFAFTQHQQQQQQPRSSYTFANAADELREAEEKANFLYQPPPPARPPYGAATRPTPHTASSASLTGSSGVDLLYFARNRSSAPVMPTTSTWSQASYLPRASRPSSASSASMGGRLPSASVGGGAVGNGSVYHPQQASRSTRLPATAGEHAPTSAMPSSLTSPSHRGFLQRPSSAPTSHTSPHAVVANSSNGIATNASAASAAAAAHAGFLPVASRPVLYNSFSQNPRPGVPLAPSSTAPPQQQHSSHLEAQQQQQRRRTSDSRVSGSVSLGGGGMRFGVADAPSRPAIPPPATNTRRRFSQEVRERYLNGMPQIMEEDEEGGNVLAASAPCASKQPRPSVQDAALSCSAHLSGAAADAECAPHASLGSNAVVECWEDAAAASRLEPLDVAEAYTASPSLPAGLREGENTAGAVVVQGEAESPNVTWWTVDVTLTYLTGHYASAADEAAAMLAAATTQSPADLRVVRSVQCRAPVLPADASLLEAWTLTQSFLRCVALTSLEGTAVARVPAVPQAYYYFDTDFQQYVQLCAETLPLASPLMRIVMVAASSDSEEIDGGPAAAAEWWTAQGKAAASTEQPFQQTSPRQQHHPMTRSAGQNSLPPGRQHSHQQQQQQQWATNGDVPRQPSREASGPPRRRRLPFDTDTETSSPVPAPHTRYAETLYTSSTAHPQLPPQPLMIEREEIGEGEEDEGSFEDDGTAAAAAYDYTGMRAEEALDGGNVVEEEDAAAAYAGFDGDGGLYDPRAQHTTPGWDFADTADRDAAAAAAFAWEQQLRSSYPAAGRLQRFRYRPSAPPVRRSSAPYRGEAALRTAAPLRPRSAMQALLLNSHSGGAAPWDAMNGSAGGGLVPRPSPPASQPYPHPPPRQAPPTHPKRPAQQYFDDPLLQRSTASSVQPAFPSSSLLHMGLADSLASRGASQTSVLTPTPPRSSPPPHLAYRPTAHPYFDDSPSSQQQQQQQQQQQHGGGSFTALASASQPQPQRHASSSTTAAQQDALDALLRRSAAAMKQKAAGAYPYADNNVNAEKSMPQETEQALPQPQQQQTVMQQKPSALAVPVRSPSPPPPLPTTATTAAAAAPVAADESHTREGVAEGMYFAVEEAEQVASLAEDTAAMEAAMAMAITTADHQCAVRAGAAPSPLSEVPPQHQDAAEHTASTPAVHVHATLAPHPLPTTPPLSIDRSEGETASASRAEPVVQVVRDSAHTTASLAGSDAEHTDGHPLAPSAASHLMSPRPYGSNITDAAAQASATHNISMDGYASNRDEFTPPQVNVSDMVEGDPHCIATESRVDDGVAVDAEERDAGDAADDELLAAMAVDGEDEQTDADLDIMLESRVNPRFTPSVAVAAEKQSSPANGPTPCRADAEKKSDANSVGGGGDVAPAARATTPPLVEVDAPQPLRAGVVVPPVAVTETPSAEVAVTESELRRAEEAEKAEGQVVDEEVEETAAPLVATPSFTPEESRGDEAGKETVEEATAPAVNAVEAPAAASFEESPEPLLAVEEEKAEAPAMEEAAAVPPPNNDDEKQEAEEGQPDMVDASAEASSLPNDGGADDTVATPAEEPTAAEAEATEGEADTPVEAAAATSSPPPPADVAEEETAPTQPDADAAAATHDTVEPAAVEGDEAQEAEEEAPVPEAVLSLEDKEEHEEEQQEVVEAEIDVPLLHAAADLSVPAPQPAPAATDEVNEGAEPAVESAPASVEVAAADSHHLMMDIAVVEASVACSEDGASAAGSAGGSGHAYKISVLTADSEPAAAHEEKEETDEKAAPAAAAAAAATETEEGAKDEAAAPLDDVPAEVVIVVAPTAEVVTIPAAEAATTTAASTQSHSATASPPLTLVGNLNDESEHESTLYAHEGEEERTSLLGTETISHPGDTFADTAMPTDTQEERSTHYTTEEPPAAEAAGSVPPSTLEMEEDGEEAATMALADQPTPAAAAATEDDDAAATEAELPEETEHTAAPDAVAEEEEEEEKKAAALAAAPPPPADIAVAEPHTPSTHTPDVEFGLGEREDAPAASPAVADDDDGDDDAPHAKAVHAEEEQQSAQAGEEDDAPTAAAAALVNDVDAPFSREHRPAPLRLSHMDYYSGMTDQSTGGMAPTEELSQLQADLDAPPMFHRSTANLAAAAAAAPAPASKSRTSGVPAWATDETHHRRLDGAVIATDEDGEDISHLNTTTTTHGNENDDGAMDAPMNAFRDSLSITHTPTLTRRGEEDEGAEDTSVAGTTSTGDVVDMLVHVGGSYTSVSSERVSAAMSSKARNEAAMAMPSSDAAKGAAVPTKVAAPPVRGKPANVENFTHTVQVGGPVGRAGSDPTLSPNNGPVEPELSPTQTPVTATADWGHGFTNMQDTDAPFPAAAAAAAVAAHTGADSDDDEMVSTQQHLPLQPSPPPPPAASASAAASSINDVDDAPAPVSESSQSPAVALEEGAMRKTMVLLGFPGSAWEYIMNNHYEPMHEAFITDASDAGGVPTSAIQDVRYSRGSLMVDLYVLHTAVIGEQEMRDQMCGYPYPRLWALYEEKKRERKKMLHGEGGGILRGPRQTTLSAQEEWNWMPKA